jgi:hypothetical protein
MTRPTKCACGRYIKPRGFAAHKRNCPEYQAGLREFVDRLPCPKPLPAAGVSVVGEDDLSRMAQVISDFTDLSWGDCKELARRIAGVTVDRHQTSSQDTLPNPREGGK